MIGSIVIYRSLSRFDHESSVSFLLLHQRICSDYKHQRICSEYKHQRICSEYKHQRICSVKHLARNLI